MVNKKSDSFFPFFFFKLNFKEMEGKTDFSKTLLETNLSFHSLPIQVTTSPIP